MGTCYVASLGLILLCTAPVSGFAEDYGCSLKGFDQTPPPAMVSPKPNVQSFDWGSDADSIGPNRGWLFWHYIRNKPGNQPIWVTWPAAGLGTSETRPLPGGGAVCEQSQVFFQLDHPNDVKPTVDNNAPIVYGSRGQTQAASIYRPVPPLTTEETRSGASRVWLYLTHLVSRYVDRGGAQHNVDVSLQTSYENGAYFLRVAAAPEKLVIGISNLPDLLNEDQRGSVVQDLRNRKATVEIGTIKPEARAALFRTIPSGGDQRYLFVSQISEAVVRYSAGDQINSFRPALLVVLDADRQPLLSSRIGLVVPSRR